MNNKYQNLFREGRKNGYSDDEIMESLQKRPEFESMYKQGEEKGLSKEDIDSSLKKNFGVDNKKEPTFIQEAARGLLGGGFLPAVGDYLSERYGFNEPKELSYLPSTAIASTLGAPKEIANAPASLAKAQFEYDNPHEESIPLQDKSFVPTVGQEPAFEEAYKKNPLLTEDIPEQGDIRGLLGFLPSFEQTYGKLVPEQGMPQGNVGEFGQRVAVGTGAGGPFGALSGALDFGLEKAGFNPWQRALLGGLATTKTAAPIIKKQTGLPPTPPKAKPSPLSKGINNINDLAFKIVSPGEDNINVPVLKAAKDLGIPLEDIPIQTLTKGGFANLLEGSMEKSLFGQKKFDNMLGNFTKTMTHEVDKIIQSIPVDGGNFKISNVAELGEPTFQNNLPKLFEDQAPYLNTTRYEGGAPVTHFLENLSENMKKEYKNLYDAVEFTKEDVIKPSDKSYANLENAANKVRETLKSKGFKGAQRKEALNVLSQFESLFKKVEPKKQIFDAQGKPLLKPEKQPIELEVLRKNLQDLNKKVSYETPGLVNLMEGVSKEIRSILGEAAEANPKLAPLLEGNKVYGKHAEIFNDPIVKKLSNMTNEQLFDAVKKNPSYLESFKKLAEDSGNVKIYNDLRGAILADTLESVFKAQSPKELNSSINPSLIKKTRELERFFPEYKGMSKALENAKKESSEFLSGSNQVKGKIRSEILEDFLLDGNFERTLKMMNTSKGLAYVRDAIKGTPQGKQILNALESKKLEQILYNGTKKTSINLEDFAKIKNDPELMSVMRNLVSKENMKQFENLATLAEGTIKGRKFAESAKGRLDKALLGGSAVTLAAGGLVAPMTTAVTLAKGVVPIYAVSKWLRSENFRKNVIKNINKTTPTP